MSKVHEFFSGITTSRPNWLLPTILLIASASLIILGLILRGGWVEPDTYAFYNRACLDGWDFNTPIFSKIFFQSLPCSLLFWFFLHGTMYFFSMLLLAWGLKKFWNIPPQWVGLVGLSIYFLQFSIAMEDDHLAWAIVFLLSWWVLSNPSWQKRIIAGIIAALLYFFVWQGAPVPLSIAIAASIHPVVAVIGLVAKLFEGALSTDPSGSSELTFGAGVVGNILLLVLLAYHDQFRELSKKHAPLFWFTVFSVIVSLFQAKWGLYTLIGLLPLSWIVLQSDPKRMAALQRAGWTLLVIAPLILLLFQLPNSEHWKVIQTAKEYQDQGKVVLNEWGVGRYFQFIGGKPTAAGGGGVQAQIPPGEWFWLGKHREDCDPILSKDLLFFERCGAS